MEVQGFDILSTQDVTLVPRGFVNVEVLCLVGIFWEEGTRYFLGSFTSVHLKCLQEQYFGIRLSVELTRCSQELNISESSSSLLV